MPLSIDGARVSATRQAASFAQRLSLGGERKTAAWEAHLRDVLVARDRVRAYEDSNPSVRSALLEACRPGSPGSTDLFRGFWFWVRTFGTAYEPRNVATGSPASLPFVPYPFQERMLEWGFDVIVGARQGLVLKPRDVGATLSWLHVAVWCWRFLSDCHILVGSRSAEKVDRAPGSQNPQTLLGRCDRIIEGMPDWMRPAGWDIKNTRRCRQEMLIMNPENGNVIEGETSNPNFGRGQRYFFVIPDELDFWADAEEVFGGLRDTAASVIYLTTPNRHKGMDSVVWSILDQGKAERFSITWDDHPYKTRQWFDREGSFRFTADIGSELELSHEGADEDLIFPSWKAVPMGHYPFQPSWPVYVGIDFGRTDGTAIVYLQRDPATLRWRFLGSYFNAGLGIDYYLPFLGKPALTSYAYSDEERAMIERVSLWMRAGASIYGDPSGLYLTQSADLSVVQQLGRYGVIVTVNEAVRRHAERQSLTRLMLANAEADEIGCQSINLAMRNYRKQAAVRGLVNPTRKPIHNWASHLATAIEYIAVSEQRAVESGDLEATGTEGRRHHARWERRRR